MRASSLVSAVVLGAALTGVLTACAAQDELPAFSQPQEERDRLPTDGTADVLDSVEESSTRFLWEDETGTTFYAARGTGTSDGYSCLVIFAGSEGHSACGGLPITVGLGGQPEYMLSVTVGGDSDEWIEVADNLYVADDTADQGR
jgi:hypothetical protein